MRSHLSKVLTCAIGIVAVLPLVFSAVTVVAFPIDIGESKSLNTLRDVNDDGRVDIVTSSGRIYFNVGENRYRSNEIVFDGTGYKLREYSFMNGTLVPLVGPATTTDPSPFFFLDQDDDGLPETIIVINFGDLVTTLYRNDGSGTFIPDLQIDITADPTPDYVAIVDLRELKKKYGEIQLL